MQKPQLSQNFLCNQELVEKLIHRSSISKADNVLEIGPGGGIITEQLVNVASKVEAIELDEKLLSRLSHKFVNKDNLTLIRGDFLDFPLPGYPYKVFANIPFSITGNVIRKLLQATNPPQDCYLIVQKEAANKFITTPNQNTMAAILYYPWWDIRITHEFERADFSPQPKVDCVLLHIEPRSHPLIAGDGNLYRDYVTYQFTRDRSAKYLLPEQWLVLPQKLKSAQGAFAKLQQEQQALQKIHRTRTDNDWKRFKKILI